jgi:hypothetical protein
MAIILEKYYSAWFYNKDTFIGRIANYEDAEMQLKFEAIGGEYQVKLEKKIVVSVWATKIIVRNDKEEVIETLEI